MLDAPAVSVILSDRVVPQVPPSAAQQPLADRVAHIRRNL